VDPNTLRLRRVLWLLGELIGPEEPDGPKRFARESSVHTLFFVASKTRLLPYDTAPVLHLWHGDTRYVQLSQEGIEDLVELERRVLIQRLELAGMDHDLLSAFRVTTKGRREALKLDGNERDELTPLVRCDCGGRLEYKTSRTAAWTVCPKCRRRVEIPCLDFPAVPYVSRARFCELLHLEYKVERKPQSQ